MKISFHLHAKERMKERGATEDEVKLTVQDGEKFTAKFGRVGFRRNFDYDNKWNNRFYHTKQIEAYAVKEDGWVVITVLVKYF
jgi:hypothetical protein